MKPKSPLDTIDDAVLRLTVSVNGNPVKDEYGIQTIQVVHAVNKISYAELVLQSKVDLASGEIPISDSDDFSPGNSINITAGYGSAGEQSIFNGFIINHAMEINPECHFILRIVCRHAAVAMTFNESEATFFNKTDSDIIAAITNNYGLRVSVDKTANQQETVVQRMGTDWDLILSRCHFNGFMVCMDGDTMRIGKPLIGEAPVLRIAAGESIISFEASISAGHQPPAIKVSSWNSNTQATVNSIAREPAVNAQGNISAATLSGMLSQTGLHLVTAAPLKKDELQSWADAELLWKRLSATRGKVTFIGNATVKTGNLVELEGVGKKFNGNAFVSAVMHTMDAGTWNTTVTFGLEYSPVHTRSGLSIAPGTIHGLQAATVKKIGEDPVSGYRILVNMANSADSQTGIWARMAGFYASSSAGAVFWPEVGDEVIVGFLENDPRFPVILGSLFSAKNQPPVEAGDANNHIKSLTTKSKMRLSFDEQKKVITITTPGNNSITISDEDKAISIADQNSNLIKLSKDGIVLNSASDISLKATGNISMDASGKISVTAGQDVVVAGLNVTHEAAIGFTGKGTATAEISASGQTTIKGAIVMIN